MRWFASWWITAVVCFAGAGFYWLAENGPERLTTKLEGFSTPNQLWIAGLVSACYALVRLIVHRVLAYTESAIDASPRAGGERGRRRAAIGAAAYASFGNPTGWWLSPFAAFLTIAGALAVVLRVSMIWIDGWQPGGFGLVLTMLLSLAVLYGATVTAAMLRPDRPQPLRPAADPPLDPSLAMPSPGAPSV